MSVLNHFTAFNEEMSGIARKFGAELRADWGIKVSSASAKGLKTQLRSNAAKRHGVVDRIGAKFPRHGIYRTVGAGRGQGGSIGSSWKDKTGKIKHVAPSSMGKMNSGNRKAIDWLSPTLDKYNEIVADRAAEHFAIIGQQIVLNGIPETKTRR